MVNRRGKQGGSRTGAIGRPATKKQGGRGTFAQGQQRLARQAATLFGGGKGRGAGGLGGLLGGDAESLNRRARKQMQSQAGGPMVTQAGAGRGRMAQLGAGRRGAGRLLGGTEKYADTLRGGAGGMGGRGQQSQAFITQAPVRGGRGRRQPAGGLAGGTMGGLLGGMGGIKMRAGGKTKAKGMAGGGKMKTKGYKAGGKMKTKGYKAGGKLPMVEKDGQMVPFYAADGKGKMQQGGKIKMSTKMMANGGMTAIRKKEGGNTVARGSGAARKQKFTKNG
jgi:hypothetical protein